MALTLKLASRAAMFGCCSLVAMATTAYAAEEPQTAAEGPSTQLEEIVVTAQRTEQNIQDVPIAVTAFSADTLEKKGVVSIADLQFHAPNMLIHDEAVTGGLGVAIRGISVSAENFAFDPAVGVYVNDVFIARANDFGATFFGRNTPAGAVLVETNGPGSEFGGYIKLGTGGGGHGVGDGADRNFYRIDGAVDLPISPTLGLRIAGFYLNDDGWARSRFNGHKFFSRDDGAVRATLDFKPTDNFEARLVADYSHVVHGGPLVKTLAYTPPTGGEPYDQLHGGTASRDQIIAGVANKDPYTNDSAITRGLVGNGYSASLHLTYRPADDWSIRSISGWRRLKRDQVNDNVGVPLQLGYVSANLRQEQVSQEFILTGDVTPQLHLVGGLFFFQEKGSDQNTLAGQVLPVGPFRFPLTLNFRGQDIKNTSKAAFVNLSYDILPTLTVSGGFRYSIEDKFVLLNSTLIFPNGTLLPPPFNVLPAPLNLPAGFTAPYFSGPKSFSDKVPLYDAKVSWQATPDLLFYAKYGTGYRAGGVGFRSNDSEFRPETARTWEAGMKADFSLGSMPARLNAAAFDTSYRNFQTAVVVTDSNNQVGQTVFNAGGAKLRGAEFEFSIRPTSNLDLSASLGLLDSHYTSFFLTDDDGTHDFSNNKLRDAPTVNFSLSAAYTLPSTVGSWLFQVDYAHKSSYYVDSLVQPNAPPEKFPSNDYRQSPTNIVNARLGLGEAFGSKLDISLWGKNLLDEKVLGFALGSDGTNEAVYGEPLSFGAELRLPF